MTKLRLKELMERDQVAESDLARAFNFKQGDVTKWARGLKKPTKKQLDDLSLYFLVDVDYLTGVKEFDDTIIDPDPGYYLEITRTPNHSMLFRSLSEENQYKAIEYIEFLLSKQKGK